MNERESARSTFENQDSGALERDSHADFALPARHGTRMRGDRRPEETLLPRCPALDNAVEGNRSSGSRHRHSQAVNRAQDSLEQSSGYGHFGQLESDSAGVTNDFRPDLDQFLPGRRQGPATNLLRQDKLAEEVSKIVGQHKEMQPHQVIDKIVARQARPLHRVLALLDPLLSRSPLIVESDNAFGRTSEVRNDEANPGKQFAFVPFNLGDHPP